MNPRSLYNDQSNVNLNLVDATWKEIIDSKMNKGYSKAKSRTSCEVLYFSSIPCSCLCCVAILIFWRQAVNNDIYMYVRPRPILILEWTYYIISSWETSRVVASSRSTSREELNDHGVPNFALPHNISLPRMHSCFLSKFPANVFVCPDMLATPGAREPCYPLVLRRRPHRARPCRHRAAGQEKHGLEALAGDPDILPMCVASLFFS